MKYNVPMREARILLISGVWVAILPYLGFPLFLKNILFSLTGIGLILISFVLYRNAKKGEEGKEEIAKSFPEDDVFEEDKTKIEEGIN